MSVLYSWHSFFQGFWLDIGSLAANADPLVLGLCFVVLTAVLLFSERKRLCVRNVLYAVAAAAYGTFLLAVTLLGRSGGIESSWDQLFSIYIRAFSGELEAMFDILYNIVLFIPVGLLAAHYRQTKAVIAGLAILPVCIELLQLITGRGLFEFSDIINNFIGGVIGFCIARIIAGSAGRLRRSVKAKH